MKYLVDTGVFIKAFRERTWPILPDKCALSVVTEAELLTGVEMSRKEATRRANREFCDLVLASLPVLDFTRDMALQMAKYRAFAKQENKGRGDNDLMIAATAAASGRTLITLDSKAWFGNLPGLMTEIRPR